MALGALGDGQPAHADAAKADVAKTPRTPPRTPDGHQAALAPPPDADEDASPIKAPAKLPPLESVGQAPSARIVLDPLPARPLPGAAEN